MITVKCLLCEEDFLRLTASHMRCAHGITLDEYCKKFPNAPLGPNRDYVGKFDHQMHHLSHRDEHSMRGEEYRRRLRYEALVYYSSCNIPWCVVCGIEDIDVLCVDHVDGLGSEQRRSSARFHRWLRDSGYPEGYQTLCANCNLKKELGRRNEIVCAENYTVSQKVRMYVRAHPEVTERLRREGKIESSVS